MSKGYLTCKGLISGLQCRVMRVRATALRRREPIPNFGVDDDASAFIPAFEIPQLSRRGTTYYLE